MLVKFISFVITIFGTKRYQPFVFASIALVVSAIGVSTVLSVYNVPSSTVASTTDHTEDATTATISADTPAKKGLHQGTDTTREGQDTTESQTSPSTGSGSAADNTTANPSTAAATAVQLTPADNPALRAGESTTLSVATSDDTAVTWSLSTDTSSPCTVTDSTAGKTSPSTSFSFTVKANTAGSCALTVHAKDNTRGVDVTKNITLTITAN